MRDYLETALRNLRYLREQNASSEQDLKRLVVEPVLLWIGIDVYDPAVLREEFKIPQVKALTRADYVIMKDGKPILAIEAKGTEENIEDGLKQLIDYCNYGNVRFGVITNGKDWWLVDEQWKQNPQRVFFKLSLDSERVSLLKLLSPQNFHLLEEFAQNVEKILQLDLTPTLKEKFLDTTAKEYIEKIGTKEPSPPSITEGWIDLDRLLQLMKDKNIRKFIKCPEKVMINSKAMSAESWTQVYREFVIAYAEKIKEPIKFPKAQNQPLICFDHLPSGVNPLNYSRLQVKGKTLFLLTRLATYDKLRAIKYFQQVLQLPPDSVLFPKEWFEELASSK